MPHRSTFLAPLHNLLRKDIPWKWSKVEDAFVAAKQLILNPQTLSFMWCFIPWCWSRCLIRCIRHLHTDKSPTKLLPVREKGTRHYFRNETIPSVFEYDSSFTVSTDHRPLWLFLHHSIQFLLMQPLDFKDGHLCLHHTIKRLSTTTLQHMQM